MLAGILSLQNGLKVRSRKDWRCSILRPTPLEFGASWEQRNEENFKIRSWKNEQDVLNYCPNKESLRKTATAQLKRIGWNMARWEQALHLRYCEDFREFTEKELRSPQFRNDIGIVILTLPFSRTSTLFIFQFLHQGFYSAGFEFQFKPVLPNSRFFDR